MDWKSVVRAGTSYENRQVKKGDSLPLTEISEYERPAVRTLLRGLYLSNHLTDLHAVIFVG